MRPSRLHVSLETVLAASPLMGHELEDRSSIRLSQNRGLFESLAERTAQPLRSRSQRSLFCVAPLDILVSQTDGRPQFHLLELNGTGIGGLSNLPHSATECVLDSLRECSGSFNDPSGVVLLAVSGKESRETPRLNRLMHEKLLFADAIRAGIAGRFGSCDVANLSQLAAQEREGRIPRPTVVIGYIRDLLDRLALGDDGRLSLHGRPVMGAVNDRFCRNVMQRFNEQVDLNLLKTFNRCFAAGSDKGTAYGLLDDYIRDSSHPSLPADVPFAHAASRDELIETVLRWLNRGRQVVIKPHGTGLGHGIEFFFSRDEPVDDIITRIDDSLHQTEEYYGVPGGALPYTVCEYVDARRLAEPGHPLEGHKYELRVVVYRDGSVLKAMPSIAKIAREKGGEEGFVRRALINNITASGDTGKVCGTDYMLPLCNWRTLELLDLTRNDLQDLCQFATGYVGYVLDQLEDAPGRFGLPEAPRPRPEALVPEHQPELVASV